MPLRPFASPSSPFPGESIPPGPGVFVSLIPGSFSPLLSCRGPRRGFTMDPLLLPTPGPTIHSPSEASYSSAPSRTSTRSTSPDISSHRSSPLLDLHHLITTSNIVPETNRTTTLTDQQPSNMEKTTSVPAASDGLNNNPRRSGNKFNIDQRTGTSANYQQQPQAGLRPGAPIGPGNLASRSLTSNNWRAHPMTDGMYNSFDPANTQNHQQPQPQLQHHFGHPTSAHQQQQQLRSSLGHPYTANDNMGSPIFPDALLDACYAYGYDRGNGQYTRLIPADMIPSLCDVPALEQDCLGMILLPVPRALPANGRSSNVEPVMLKVSITKTRLCLPPLLYAVATATYHSQQ